MSDENKFIVIAEDGAFVNEAATPEKAVEPLEPSDYNNKLTLYRRVGDITPKKGVNIDDPDGLLA